MNFNDIKSDFETNYLLELLEKRQTKVIPDSYGRYYFRDTLSLISNFSGKDRRNFIKKWFKQLRPDGERAVLYVNKKHRYSTNGKYADKELVELIDLGYLVMKREGLLRSRDSYLIWSGK